MEPLRNGGNIGFRFPDPRMIGGSKNMASYVVSWLGSRAYHMWLIGQGAVNEPINKQQWRDFLNNVKLVVEGRTHGSLADPTLLGPSSTSAFPTTFPTTSTTSSLASLKRPLPSSNDETNRGSKKRRSKKPNVYLEQLAYPFVQDAPDHVFWLDRMIMLGGSLEDIEQQLCPEITAEVIWELFELNFRFELLSLDRAAAPEMWEAHDGLTKEAAQISRDEQVRSVFALDGGAPGSYVLLNMPNLNGGLAAENWMDRAPHIFALVKLMSPWKGYPVELRNSSAFMSEMNVEAIEQVAVKFYHQTFFNYFHRLAISPHRLPTSSITADST